MAIIVENGHGDSSSNSERDCVHFTHRKRMNLNVLPPVMGK